MLAVSPETHARGDANWCSIVLLAGRIACQRTVEPDKTCTIAPAKSELAEMSVMYSNELEDGAANEAAVESVPTAVALNGVPFIWVIAIA